VSCGAETKVGVLLCAQCLEGIMDPFSLMPRALDPFSDARLQHMSSAMLRIGPVVGSDLVMGGGPEPALLLREMLERRDRSRVPTFVEEYLAAIGISLHLWGYERLPRRTFAFRLIEDTQNLDFHSEIWARACVRMANVHSLLILSVSDLPLDPSWSTDFQRERSKDALRLYAQAEAYPSLHRIAQSNKALMYDWLGQPSEALAILDKIINEKMDEDYANITLKKAMVLCESGRRAESSQALELIPDALMDERAKKFKADLEGSR